MINRRRRRCMMDAIWSTTPEFRDVGGSRQLQYGHHVTAAVITRSKIKYYHVTNERTSSPTIDLDGLSNGKAASILSLFAASPRHVPSDKDKIHSVHAHSSCRTARKLCANERAAHAGLRASNLCVLSAPLPRNSYIRPKSGVQRKGPEVRNYPSDRLAVAAPSALLPAKRSGATCVWSSLFFKLPKPGGKIKTQKKPKEFSTRTAGFCGERQDKQTRTKASRSHGERDLSVEKCFAGW